MTVSQWRKTAIALLAIMTLVLLVLIVQLMERMAVADQLRDAAQSEEKLGRRVYDDGSYIVQEMLSAILRAGVPGEDADAMEADKDRMKTLQDRAEKVFSSPPLELTQDEKDVFKTVLEDLRLHREQTEAWLASNPAERLAALPELDESRNTLLNDVNKLIGVRSEKLLRQVNDLRESSHGTRWLLLLTSLTFAALLGGILRAVHMGWVRPLALKAATADRLAASREDLAELGTVAAGLAHEIRNPVGALKNRAYALSLLVEAESNPKAAAQITSMDGELDRIERIVRDFLRYARPSDPKLAACSVAEVAESFHRDFCGEMAARGVSFQVHVENNTIFQADPQQVRQVLLNLTRNAADACLGQENARVSLHASVVPGRVIFAVSDNGGGLSEEASGNLFVPFATSKRGGTGLGLAVSRAIARKHGGDLVLAATGEGITRFELHLPA